MLLFFLLFFFFSSSLSVFWLLVHKMQYNIHPPKRSFALLLYVRRPTAEAQMKVALAENPARPGKVGSFFLKPGSDEDIVAELGSCVEVEVAVLGSRPS